MDVEGGIGGGDELLVDAIGLEHVADEEDEDDGTERAAVNANSEVWRSSLGLEEVNGLDEEE